MSEPVTIALIVSIAPTIAAFSALLVTLYRVIPKLNHITVLTNSTLTAANRRIDELEIEVHALKAKLLGKHTK